MKEIFLFVLSVVLLCRLALAEDSPWYVSFYQDPNAGGLSVKLDVSPVGTAIPIDEFAKYHLEGENGISEIRYKLPQGVVLVCFTRRFFKSTDSDIANFINNSDIKALRGSTGYHKALRGSTGHQVWPRCFGFERDWQRRSRPIVGRPEG